MHASRKSRKAKVKSRRVFILNKDFNFIIVLSASHLTSRTTLRNKVEVIGLTKPEVTEPKWLTADAKKVFDHKVRALPGGLRLTKLTSKRKRS